MAARPRRRLALFFHVMETEDVCLSEEKALGKYPCGFQ